MSESSALWRTTAIAGLVTLGLQIAAQAFIQVGGPEPPFDAAVNDVAAFFTARDRQLFAIGSYLSVLSVLCFLWFVGGLYRILRADWRAPIVLACGLGYAAGVGVVGWELAVVHDPQSLDPQLARLAFDIGNLSFATAWVMLGGAAIAAGWAILAGDELPAWMGWWAIAAGLSLVAARAVWTTPVWFFAYAAFWVWAVALSVTLLRRSSRTDDAARPEAVSTPVVTAFSTKSST